MFELREIRKCRWKLRISFYYLLETHSMIQFLSHYAVSHMWTRTWFEVDDEKIKRNGKILKSLRLKRRNVIKIANMLHNSACIPPRTQSLWHYSTNFISFPFCYYTHWKRETLGVLSSSEICLTNIKRVEKKWGKELKFI